MESVLRFVLRLLLVPLGGVVAITAATTVVLVAHWNEIAMLANASPDGVLIAGSMLGLLLPLAVFLLAVPAAVGALIAEALAIRSWIFHALNGGLSAWIGWARMDYDPNGPYPFLFEPKVMVAAGLAGGLAYWAVAGWTAGFWKPVFGPEPARV